MHKIQQIYLQNLHNMLLSKHEMDTTSKSKLLWPEQIKNTGCVYGETKSG